VHRGDPFSAAAPRHLEGVAHHPFTALAGHYHLRFGVAVIRAGKRILSQVSTLGVLAHRDQVDAFIACSRARHADRRAHVGIQIEARAQFHIERAEAATDRRGQRPLEHDPVALDRIQRGLGQQAAMRFLRGQTCQLKVITQTEPERVKRTEHSVHDFRADAIAANYRDCRHSKFFRKRAGDRARQPARAH